MRHLFLLRPPVPSYSPPVNKTAIPHQIILDTTSLVKELNRILGSLEDCTWDRDQTVEKIMEYICDRQNGMLGLSYDCAGMVTDTLGEPYADRVQELANTVVSFGELLQHQLVLLGVYQNNYLHYQFDGWIGNDLMLTRLIPPTIK